MALLWLSQDLPSPCLRHIREAKVQLGAFSGGGSGATAHRDAEQRMAKATIPQCSELKCKAVI